MSTTYSDQQIRTALEGIITTAAPLAVVYPWWVLGVKQDMWPGLMRSSSDSDRVHGYVITRAQDEGVEKAMRCVNRSWSYDIWALHYYQTGNRIANSDLTFNTELDLITAALDDIVTVPNELKRRQPIRWTIDLNVYGGELLHFAVGSITIDPC